MGFQRSHLPEIEVLACYRPEPAKHGEPKRLVPCHAVHVIRLLDTPSVPLIAALAAACREPAFAWDRDDGPVRPGRAKERLTAIEFGSGVPDRLHVASKSGRAYAFWNGQMSSTVLDLTSQVLEAGEGGLLGLTLDPDFETNWHLYVAYTQGSPSGVGDSVISRFTTLPGSVDQADPASELIRGPFLQRTTGHKGGDLEFGPEGMLHHSIGDGDAGNSGKLPTPMDPSDPRGKVLRFDVRAPYPHVPADKLFAGSTTENEHVRAYGFRNGFRMEVAPLTGNVFVADVGSNQWEEITRLPATVTPGAVPFAGWPCREGDECRDFQGCARPSPLFVDPILFLSHAAPDNACAIMGGIVVRGGAIPSLEGAYLFNDLCTGRFYRVDDPNGPATVVEITGVLSASGGAPINFIRDYTQGPDGKVYLAACHSADIWVLEPLNNLEACCSSAVSSTGSVASISLGGSPSIADGSLRIEVTNAPASAFGLMLLSRSRGSTPNFGQSQGTLCLSPPIHRWAPGGVPNSAGALTVQTDLSDLSSLIQVAAGETWNFPFWFRDANPQPTSKTTNGASVLFIP